MKYLTNMDRNKLNVAGLVVAALFLFFVNIVANGEIKSARLDLTENKLFTLSQGTKKVLSEIDEALTFYFYYSPKLGEISPSDANYALRVRELLENYALLANGKIDLKIINPVAFSVEEDQAVNFGVQGIPLDQSGEQGYFGLAATNSTDDRDVIAYFNGRREQFLEYDLTRLIFSLANPEKKTVGLITSLPIEADMLRQYKPWPILGQIQQFLAIKSVQTDAKVIDDDIDVLLLAHPKIIEDQTYYAIDQFIMKGGKAVVILDPYNESARISPRLPPGAGTSELKKLFDPWGIEVTEDKFIGDRTIALRVSAPVGDRQVVADYLSWLIFGEKNLNQKDVVTSQLNSIAVASIGAITLKKGSSLKITPLIQTSKQSQRISTKMVQGEPNPLAIIRAFKSENKIFTVAARIQGKVKSAFPKGPPPEKKQEVPEYLKKDAAAKSDEEKKRDKEEAEKKAKERIKLERAHLAESKGEINLIVVADSDMLSTQFWAQEQDFFGQKVLIPVANNADFLVNALDNLSGSDALIGLRSRGLSIRPFQKLVTIRNVAEDRYRKTEEGLSRKLKELQEKIREFKVKKGPDSTVILSAKQKKTFETFRRDMIETRGQLRDVQLDLRKDIERMDSWLKVINIWAVPVLVAFVAIVLALIRRRRYAVRSI